MDEGVPQHLLQCVLDLHSTLRDITSVCVCVGGGGGGGGGGGASHALKYLDVGLVADQIYYQAIYEKLPCYSVSITQHYQSNCKRQGEVAPLDCIVTATTPVCQRSERPRNTTEIRIAVQCNLEVGLHRHGQTSRAKKPAWSNHSEELVRCCSSDYGSTSL